MINVSIFSSDELFSRMLLLEVEGMGKAYSVRVNAKWQSADIVVLDLDSEYACGDYGNATVIGFSKNESAVDTKNVNKCSILLHRPFLVSEFLRYIEVLSSEPSNDVERTENKLPDPDKRLCFRKDGSITLDGREIHLSENEISLLKKLYENMGKAVIRAELGEALSSNDGNICDVYICKLRSKLEGHGSEKFIYTVRSKGYMLKL